MSTTQTEKTESTEIEIQPPSLYDVIFFNDNKTQYEFVVLILMHIFGKSYETAMDLTHQIHEKGREAVATYSYEIASTKRDETITTARANGHPLRVEIEPTSSDGE